MFRAARLAAAILSAATLSGCVVAIGNDGFDDEQEWEQRQERNNRYIRSLELGQRLAAVEADLGKADIKETFQRDGDTFTVLYYRTKHHHSDGDTTRDETTPLVFVDDILVGYGTTAIDHATK